MQRHTILSYKNRKKTNKKKTLVVVTVLLRLYTNMYIIQDKCVHDVKTREIAAAITQAGCFFDCCLSNLLERTARHRRRVSTGLGQPKVSFKFHLFVVHIVPSLCRSTRAKRNRYSVSLWLFTYSLCFIRNLDF